MTRITSREFRANQSKYFDLANSGEKVMISRRNQMFMLTPISDDELIMTPELEARIAQARKEYAEGMCVGFDNIDDMQKWLDNL